MKPSLVLTSKLGLLGLVCVLVLCTWSIWVLQLEAISEMNPIDLRKQLMVEFKGEEGIDEGGLQKELFQLLVEKLFDPMYGKRCGYGTSP